MTARRPERVHATLFVPGLLPGPAAWRGALEARGYRCTEEALSGGDLGFEAGLAWVENPWDRPFAEAFSFTSLGEAEQRAIDAVPGALVLTLPVDLHRERAAISSLARALAASGAVAVRIEESRVGHPISRWVELVAGNDPWSLYRAAVAVHPGEGGATTRGMHVFSLPDAHVTYDRDTNETVASALMGVLNVFELTDDPLLRTGHTFSADAGSPRRVLERWPDGLHAPGHPCHNPFGVWRIGPAGVTPGGHAPELELVFSPPLVTVLATREKRTGRALTRDEAEDLADRAACAAMDPHEARELERRRGHADLEPDRVFEQWQVLRRR